MNRAFSRKKDKTWMHTPEALSKHYIPYNAKFLGSTEVEQPKGTEVVRDAVRKLKFARHIKKSEGQKIPKVELQISIYGVKILEPKTKEVQHNCQLHRISFCADDKTDKRIFTFICKDSESNKHLCYVFDSEKCAEEITLTIGQAFDLAYRKFLESGGKDVETRKQIAGLQKRSSRSSRCWIQDLETENMELKNKVQDLESQLRITQVSTSPAGSVTPRSPSTDIFDMIPFSPISHPASMPAHNGTQPPPIPSRSTEIKRDLFGAEPFDPFNCGAGDFPPDIQSKLDEMQISYSIPGLRGVNKSARENTVSGSKSLLANVSIKCEVPSAKGRVMEERASEEVQSEEPRIHSLEQLLVKAPGTGSERDAREVGSLGTGSGRDAREVGSLGTGSGRDAREVGVLE
ncbi:PTB domain-containing engulfment adapter protein 1 isoform X3 [Mirounga angustirostris]|uniref:PTB domain-containing engulfment adapter protein 1 isoform X3 n=1 Tax=Mirounga angustirostris TaxID=9716 RepID=UPI00313F1758